MSKKEKTEPSPYVFVTAGMDLSLKAVVTMAGEKIRKALLKQVEEFKETKKGLKKTVDKIYEKLEKKESGLVKAAKKKVEKITKAVKQAGGDEMDVQVERLFDDDGNPSEDVEIQLTGKNDGYPQSTLVVQTKIPLPPARKKLRDEYKKKYAEKTELSCKIASYESAARDHEELERRCEGILVELLLNNVEARAAVEQTLKTDLKEFLKT